MRDTHIILLDGLPCTGKSITTQRLALHLEKQGIDVRWFLEIDEAYPVFTAHRYHTLWTSDADLSEVLTACDEQAEIPWKQLVADLQGTKRVLCLECAVFQNPITSLLLMGAEPADISRHVLRLFEAINPLNPALIYTYPGKPAEIIAELAGKRGDAFVNYLLDSIKRTPYGLRQNFHDRSGLARVWETLKSVTDDIFSLVPVPKLAIDTLPGQWDSYLEQIVDFLSIPPFEPFHQPPSDDLSVLAGAYSSSDSSESLTIHTDGRHLYFGTLPKFRLIHHADMSFYIEGLPGKIAFMQNVEGKIEGFRGYGCLAELNTIWEKV